MPPTNAQFWAWTPPHLRTPELLQGLAGSLPLPPVLRPSEEVGTIDPSSERVRSERGPPPHPPTPLHSSGQLHQRECFWGPRCLSLAVQSWVNPRCHLGLRCLLCKVGSWSGSKVRYLPRCSLPRPQANLPTPGPPETEGSPQGYPALLEGVPFLGWPTPPHSTGPLLPPCGRRPQPGGALSHPGRPGLFPC